MIDETLEVHSHLETIYFSQILHCLLRANDTEEEVARATGCWIWFGRNIDRTACVLTPEERRTVAIGWNYFRKHDRAPSREIMETMAIEQELSDEITDQLKFYDDVKASLKASSSLDMDEILAGRIRDYKETLLIQTLSKAKRIVANQYKPPVKGMPQLAGYEDSVAYLHQKTRDGIRVGEHRWYLCGAYRVSERHACGVVVLPHATHRYQSIRDSAD